MSEVKNFSPDIGLIVEDHLPSQKFFFDWMNRNYPEIEIKLFGQLGDAQDWLNDNRKTISNKSLLAFIDIGLPDGSGLDLIKELSSVSKNCKSVVITIQDDHETLFQALRNGATGYVLKHEKVLLLEKILARISEGECPLSPSIAQKIINHFHLKPSSEDCNLTPREEQTLKFIAKGLTVQEVAMKMEIKPSTVSGYIKIIYQKLHISSRAEATQKAIMMGLI